MSCISTRSRHIAQSTTPVRRHLSLSSNAVLGPVCISSWELTVKFTGMLPSCWHHMDSSKLTIVEVFIPWKLANATNHIFFLPFRKLVVKYLPVDHCSSHTSMISRCKREKPEMDSQMTWQWLHCCLIQHDLERFATLCGKRSGLKWEHAGIHGQCWITWPSGQRSGSRKLGRLGDYKD